MYPKVEGLEGSAKIELDIGRILIFGILEKVFFTNRFGNENRFSKGRVKNKVDVPNCPLGAH